ncbi:MAG: hypothetical protein JW806_03505 [Sedimentisphaerales bacterium]|nr:hypothetical protein [Sedimentisphaerales bacterium]
MSALTKKQLTVIDDLFNSAGDESTVLQKHKISRKLWNDWLSVKDFTDEIAARMEAAKRRSRIILSQHAPFAAAKLVELCQSENQETSRKAVLDILNLQTNQPEILSQISNSPLPSLDAKTASKLLAALADDKP